MIYKNKKLIGYFVSNQDSSYYQSPKFEKVLKFVQENGNRVQMRERNDKLSLVFSNVGTLDKAILSLEEIMQ